MRNARQLPEAFEPFDFHWDVTASGYQWITTTSLAQPAPPRPPDCDAGEDEKAFFELDLALSRPRRWLTDGAPSGYPKSVRRYAPLRYQTVLFRIFAATEITEDAIAAFAGQWGSLLGPLGPLVRLEGPMGNAQLTHGEELELWQDEILQIREMIWERASRGDPEWVSLTHGEELKLWQDEILQIREMIELWERASRGDREWVSRFVRWSSKGDRVYYEGPLREGYYRYGLIADLMLSPKVLREFSHGDVLEPARYYVQLIVNDHLELHTSMLVLWHGGRLRRRVVPKNLLGYLWLQFAHAIDGERDYRECAECGRWFELGRGSRPDKLYCSRACKQAAYRKRHDVSPSIN